MAEPTRYLEGCTLADKLVVKEDIQVDSLGGLKTREVHNATGGPLTAGMLVTVTGYNTATGLLNVAKADADDPTKPAMFILLDAIADGASGTAAQEYIQGGLNTNAGVVGDPVYLSATDGGWTLTAPTGASQIVQKVGQIVVKSATVGSIWFYLSGASQAPSKVGTGSLQALAIAAANLSASLQAVVSGQREVYNATGGILAVGTLVAISGYDATEGLPTVLAATPATPGLEARYVVIESIGIAGTGTVQEVYELTDLNTNAGVVGDPVYLAVSGGWTLTKPTAEANEAQKVGVITVKSATVGKILFAPIYWHLLGIVSAQIQTGAVKLANLEADLKTEIVPVGVLSFETDLQAAVPVYFNHKVTVNKIRSVVIKALAGTDAGTLTGSNTDGDSANGVITIPLSSALSVEGVASPTTNNAVAKDGKYTITPAKTTAGGEVLVFLEVTRTA
jgi:predicted ThiF/HesA family dinucleotide-utilizing enzyme